MNEKARGAESPKQDMTYFSKAERADFARVEKMLLEDFSLVKDKYWSSLEKTSILLINLNN